MCVRARATVCACVYVCKGLCGVGEVGGGGRRDETAMRWRIKTGRVGRGGEGGREGGGGRKKRGEIKRLALGCRSVPVQQPPAGAAAPDPPDRRSRMRGVVARPVPGRMLSSSQTQLANS